MVALVFLNAASVRASDIDELWKVTSKMMMPGLPFAMWASEDKICVEVGDAKDPDKIIPKYLKDQECKMGDVRISGNHSSWIMNCGGKNPASGTGEMTLDDGTFKGKSIMQSMGTTFTLVYEGKLVGTCQEK